jgi:hypothetical protein
MMTHILQNRRDRQENQSLQGQVMILFAVSMIVLVGVLALAVDAGFLLAERRQNQAAVDAAALSAAVAMLDKQPGSVVQASGKSYGAVNAGVTESEVSIEWPAPGTDKYSGNEFVRATITKEVQKFFLGAIYGGKWEVTNTAVAGIDTIPKPYALVALNCPGIMLNGGIQINIAGNGSAISNCDISNSGNSSIFSVGGSIDAVGTIQSNTLWVAPDGINAGSNAIVDPLAGATKPTKPAEVTLPACLTQNVDTCVIAPGSYTNKSFTIRPNMTVCMLPGVYYLDGNTTISFQSTTSTLTNKRPHSIPGTHQCPSGSGVAGGVIIYIAPGSTASIDLGNGKMDLSTAYPAMNPVPDPLPPTGACDPAAAPYAGAPCGMVFWIANGTPFTNSGNAIAKFEGVIYAPQSHVTLQGTPGSDGLQVIVGELSLGGNAEFNIDYRQYVRLQRPAIFLVQ